VELMAHEPLLYRAPQSATPSVTKNDTDPESELKTAMFSGRTIYVIAPRHLGTSVSTDDVLHIAKIEFLRITTGDRER
jgi:hypothetical protein